MLAGHRSIFGSEPFFAQPGAFYVQSGPPILPRGSEFGGVREAARWGRWLVMLEAQGRAIAAYDLVRWSDSYPPRQPGEPREIRPGPGLTVPEVLPGAEPPIECMTVVDGVHSGLAFIARTAGERGLYLLTHSPGQDTRTWKAERIDVLDGALSSEATACAGGQNVLYVALKDQGILRLDIGQYPTGRPLDWRRGGKVMARGSLNGPAGPVNFTALAVADIDYAWEVLYAVAGDDAVYRFSGDLRPDQRIELTLPPVRDGRFDRSLP
jgi:hypothetical protein